MGLEIHEVKISTVNGIPVVNNTQLHVNFNDIVLFYTFNEDVVIEFKNNIFKCYYNEETSITTTAGQIRACVLQIEDSVGYATKGFNSGQHFEYTVTNTAGKSSQPEIIVD